MSEALVTALVALIDSRIGRAETQSNQSVQSLAAQVVQADPFGLSGAPAQAVTIEVTPKMIQELIMPMISDENKKLRLQAAMQELGITELPAARPEQLPALYAKFKAIADETAGAPAASSGGINLI